MTLGDVRHAALRRVLLVDGQVNDLEHQWLVQRLESVEPYTGPMQLNDLWDAFLTAEGIADGALPERKALYFAQQTGVDGARPDLELAFWQTL